MKKIVLSTLFLMLVSVVFPGCTPNNHELPPQAGLIKVVPSSYLPAEQSPDDLLPIPAGYSYRANVHGMGLQEIWPPIPVAETTLSRGKDFIRVYYRDRIQAEAGQSRNNLIGVIKPDTMIADTDFKLYAVSVPEEVTVSSSSYGGAPGFAQEAVTLVIAPDTPPGEYAVQIGIMVKEQYYGTVTCTVEVVQKLSYLPEIPSGAQRVMLDYGYYGFNDENAPDNVANEPPKPLMYAAEKDSALTPVEETSADLTRDGQTISIDFRNNIETLPGETRNAIFRLTHLDIEGADSTKIYLYASGVPDNISLGQGLGDIGRGYLLRISVLPDVSPGMYTFSIGIIIGGLDYGSVPVTVNVLPQ